MENYKKIGRVIKYLKGEKTLSLEAGKVHIVKCGLTHNFLRTPT